MTFIDYPDHLPRGPLSPEAAALWERWKEICAAHNVKIVLSKPAPLPLDFDLVLPSLSTVGAGPLTWFVDKNRPAPSDTPLCFQGETMTMTPTLMTAAEMRAHLIEQRRLRLEADEMEAKRGEERRKVWAEGRLAQMLETLMQGTKETSHACDALVDAEAIMALARVLGYQADIDCEDDSYYAVVKAPSLDVEELLQRHFDRENALDAAPPKMRVHCDEYHAHRESCLIPDEVAS